MQKQNKNESSREPKPVNPRILEMLASASTAPESLRFNITDIGGEQCLTVQIVKLSDELKATFEGAGESQDKDLRRDWLSLYRDLELLGGDEGVEVQAVRTGETGRQKELQAAIFGIHSGVELMDAVYALNDLRKSDGVEPEEGLPANIAYLPENILVATKEFRANSAAELEGIAAAQRIAREMGAVATSSRDGSLVSTR